MFPSNYKPVGKFTILINISLLSIFLKFLNTSERVTNLTRSVDRAKKIDENKFNARFVSTKMNINDDSFSKSFRISELKQSDSSFSSEYSETTITTNKKLESKTYKKYHLKKIKTSGVITTKIIEEEIEAEKNTDIFVSGTD